MAQAITFGGAGSIAGSTSLTPAPSKGLQNANYLSNADYTFAQQFLPDLYEKEFEKYGNRSIASFLRMVGAELPSSSDLIKWTEQGRLHVQASGVVTDGNTITSAGHDFRTNQTIIVSNANASIQIKALITDASAANSIEVAPYSHADMVTGAGSFTAADACKIFVFGSEFKKGTSGMSGSLQASMEAKENNPIIIKDKYEVSGSEMAHVGWVEVTTETGASESLCY